MIRPRDVDALLELAERCGEVEGPCMGLNADIELATGNWTEHHYEAWQRYQECGEAVNPPMGIPVNPQPFTASLDAALTLVPEDIFWRVGHDGDGPDPADFLAELMAPFGGGFHEAVATTPALAICAAALIARSAKA